MIYSAATRLTKNTRGDFIENTSQRTKPGMIEENNRLLKRDSGGVEKYGQLLPSIADHLSFQLLLLTLKYPHVCLMKLNLLND